MMPPSNRSGIEATVLSPASVGKHSHADLRDFLTFLDTVPYQNIRECP